MPGGEKEAVPSLAEGPKPISENEVGSAEQISSGATTTTSATIPTTNTAKCYPKSRLNHDIKSQSALYLFTWIQEEVFQVGLT